MHTISKSTSLTLAATALLFAGCKGTAEKQKGTSAIPEKPNIILIMTDDVAFEHWSAYGGEIPTPHIDRLANEGMLFKQAYATAATCTPSRYSILTGQYPGRCIHDDFLSTNPSDEPYLVSWNTPLSERNTTLHKVMNMAGYSTGYVGKFHVGSLHFDKPEYNQEIPFIERDIDLDTNKADSLLFIYQSVISKRVKTLTGADFAAAIQWENSEEIPVAKAGNHNLEYQVWGTKKFLDQTPEDEPFFLTINSTALHGPNHFRDLKKDPVYTIQGRINELQNIMPSRQSVFERLDQLGISYGENEKDHINHYHTGIIYLDDQVGTIMKLLEEREMLDNTLIILTADHNVEPGKATIYEKGVKTPFIAWWPGIIPANSESNNRIQFIDFLPTFAQLGGLEIDGKWSLDGQSFVPVLVNPSIDNRLLYFEKGYFRGISDGRFKYIALRFPQSTLDSLAVGKADRLTHMGSGRSFFSSISMKYYPGYYGADQLYDLENDPWEQVNLAYQPEYQAELQEMQQSLKAILDTFNHPYDLDDDSFMEKDFYLQAAQYARDEGTDWIPWWNRELDFPPTGNSQ